MLAMKKQVLGDFQAEGQTSNTHCHSSEVRREVERKKRRTERAVTLNSSHDRSK